MNLDYSRLKKSITKQKIGNGNNILGFIKKEENQIFYKNLITLINC